MKFIIWIKEKRHYKWQEQGDGPLTAKQALRIEREIRHLCWATKVLPEGTEPAPRREIGPSHATNLIVFSPKTNAIDMEATDKTIARYNELRSE